METTSTETPHPAPPSSSRWSGQSQKDLMTALILAIVAVGLLLRPELLMNQLGCIPLVTSGVLACRGYFYEEKKKTV